MLVISRKKAQKIILADEIEITILEVGRNRVRFGIKAPKHVTIHTHIKDTPAERDPEGEPVEPAESIEAELPVVAGMSKRS